jgi:lipopolysaccharide transport system ATP-binding protein
MGNYAVQVKGLGKRYRIGERQQYKALRDVLADALTAPARAADRLLRGQGREPQPDRTIWALKDVSFEVAHGEVLGIIGRNGAGKSTLLKILSRITEPTEGEVRLRGRVGSLLEVGTGFHPELTGRENIFLNGAVLGMTRAEIERKFDEIVAFAEVERFIDTPVKHYSSGMAVRLGFAVAAHLEPEILLVDEVLAVGDAAFRQKCLGKMGDVAREGRTVLFVSHNMAAVENLCSRALLLEDGQVQWLDSANATIASYVARTAGTRTSVHGGSVTGSGGRLELLSLSFIDEALGQPGIIGCGRTLRVCFELRAARSVRTATFLLAIKNRSGDRVSVLNSTLAGYHFDLEEGAYEIRCDVPRFPISPGVYDIELKILSQNDHLLVIPVVTELVVEASDFHGSGRLPDSKWGGVCQLHQTWEVSQQPVSVESLSAEGGER